MECREDCGACCTAPSINQAYFGMPEGKPAGVACTHLDPGSKKCAIWMTPQYPEVCRDFLPEASVCGKAYPEAIRLIGDLERDTSPSVVKPK